MGALLIVFKRQKRDISTIVVIVGINLVSNLFTNASLLGHLGGFVIGGLLTLAMVKAPQKNRNALPDRCGRGGRVLLVGGMFALRAAELDTRPSSSAEIAKPAAEPITAAVRAALRPLLRDRRRGPVS